MADLLDSLNTGAGVGRFSASPPSSGRLTAVIVGAGRSGLLAAARLIREGITGFVVVEKASGVGGRWTEDLYPGALTAVPSHLCAYSFAPKPDWPQKFASQPQMQAYLANVAETEGVMQHLVCDTEVTRAAFHDATGLWHVETRTGQSWDCRFLILATGARGSPAIPAIPGRRDFAGIQFSAGKWNPSANAKGKRIVVVGTESGAVQFIPRLAEQADQLTIVQDRPTWVVPQDQHDYAGWLKTLFQWCPPARLTYRAWLRAHEDWRESATRHPGGWQSRSLEREARERLLTQIADSRLRERLIPDEPLGKRQTQRSSDYYPALARKNVELATERPVRIHQTGVELASGRRIPAEILIWAAGSDSGKSPGPVQVTGRGGTEMEGDQARQNRFKGILASGFPGLVLLFPQGGRSDRISDCYFAEPFMHSALKLIRLVLRRDLRFADIRPEAAMAWQQKMNRRDRTRAQTYLATALGTARFDPRDFVFSTFGQSATARGQGEPSPRPTRP